MLNQKQLENVESLKYLGSLLTNGGRCTCEIKSRIVMACNSAVSILRILQIDTAELHRIYDNMLQHAQKCIAVQGDHFQHLL
jgi:hypothetical protein